MYPDLKTYRAEFHVHTVLSPCAGIEMIPPLIVQAAIEKEISIIGITDHNHSANAKAVIKAALNLPLHVLPGMEVQTAEEVHCLCLFDTLEQVHLLQNLVDEHLPEVPNNVEFFGEQFIVDETGDFLTNEDRLLINSASISIDDVCQFVNELGGLFIPAHVNREAFGLLSHLGFVPPTMDVPALEISRHISVADAYKKFPQISKYKLIQSGDVHFLDDFLGINQLLIEKPSIEEIKLALSGSNSRKLSILNT